MGIGFLKIFWIFKRIQIDFNILIIFRGLLVLAIPIPLIYFAVTHIFCLTKERGAKSKKFFKKLINVYNMNVVFIIATNASY